MTKRLIFRDCVDYMPRLQNYVKKVACLEGDWNGWQDKSTVTPILQLVSGQVKGFDYFHRRLSSEETDSFEFSLSELADFMGRKFAGRVVHFGSCSTLRVSEHEIQDFLVRTEAAMVTGYTKDVYWMESAAFETVFLPLAGF